MTQREMKSIEGGGVEKRAEWRREPSGVPLVLLEALQAAVERGGEGVAFAQQMFARTGRAAVVLARRGGRWRVDGSGGIPLPPPELMTARDPAEWLAAATGEPWTVQRLRHGRRLVAQLLLAGDAAPGPAVAQACLAATAFFAAVSGRRTSSTFESHATQIVHDLKQPIAVVQLAMRELADSAGAATAARCRRSLERMRSLVEDLLLLAPEQQRAVDETDLCGVIGEVIADLTPLAREHAVVLRLGIDAPAPVRARRLALVRAMANVMQNAVEHSPEGGVVRVHIGGDGHQVCVDISDDGPGIAPELRERVFEPFFTTRHGGSGLGLAVARAAIEAHGGCVVLAGGPGCTVRITLPRAASGLQ
jgi:signal transduction histidine kinase